jgi:hypothetical protein
MMNDLRSPLLRIAPLAAVVLVALAMAGCSKKITAADPSYTSPEGTTETSAQQIVYPDLPVAVQLWKLRRTNCDECVDTLMSTSPVYVTGPGGINGMILDGTAASSYEILRRELNGGYAPLYDYVLNPSLRFPQSGWKLFAWQDRRPSGFDPPTYLGRGVVSGVVTTTTPLTNVAVDHEVVVENIFLVSDSLRSIGYTPVTSATGYIAQVYEMKNGYEDAALFNAAPAPIASQDHRDFLVDWLPATDGIIDNSQVKHLLKFGFIPGAFYALRMAAVDGQGRLVGFSSGEWWGISGPEEGYLLRFRGGAYIVKAATIQSTGSEPARGGASGASATQPTGIRFYPVTAPSPSRETPLRQVKDYFGARSR